MTNSKIKRTWPAQLNKLNENSNENSTTREELIMGRLERTLGKPRQEVTKLITKNLLALLTLVPFSTEKFI